MLHSQLNAYKEDEQSLNPILYQDVLKHHPEYDSYGKPSWKLKAGESSKPWIDDYVPMPNTYLNMAEAAKGAEPIDPKQYVQDVKSTSLSSNDSARG